jgi:CheY-like chemotaxis protein
MSKIMLVEDDNNLREIYEARLLAEGYEIVSAHDGEEALALAVKEKPDLIISDVMMPKISGFDMLDILRSTPETKDTKVIMMTALSQAEDKSRADKLGADRYLVKSQVTLEDVAKIAREVLDGVGNITASAPLPPVSAPEPVAMPSAMPVMNAPEPVVAAPVTAVPVLAAPVMPVATAPDPATDSPTVDPIMPVTSTLNNVQTTTAEQAVVTSQVNDFVQQADIAPVPVAAAPVAATDTQQNINGKKIISPINDPTVKPDLNQLLANEEAKNQTATPTGEATPGQDPNLIAL